jgi:hypothetical protein
LELIKGVVSNIRHESLTGSVAGQTASDRTAVFELDGKQVELANMNEAIIIEVGDTVAVAGKFTKGGILKALAYKNISKSVSANMSVSLMKLVCYLGFSLSVILFAIGYTIIFSAILILTILFSLRTRSALNASKLVENANIKPEEVTLPQADESQIMGTADAENANTETDTRKPGGVLGIFIWTLALLFRILGLPSLSKKLIPTKKN